MRRSQLCLVLGLIALVMDPVFADVSNANASQIPLSGAARQDAPEFSRWSDVTATPNRLDAVVLLGTIVRWLVVKDIDLSAPVTVTGAVPVNNDLAGEVAEVIDQLQVPLVNALQKILYSDDFLSLIKSIKSSTALISNVLDKNTMGPFKQMLYGTSEQQRILYSNILKKPLFPALIANEKFQNSIRRLSWLFQDASTTTTESAETVSLLETESTEPTHQFQPLFQFLSVFRGKSYTVMVSVLSVVALVLFLAQMAAEPDNYNVLDGFIFAGRIPLDFPALRPYASYIRIAKIVAAMLIVALGYLHFITSAYKSVHQLAALNALQPVQELFKTEIAMVELESESTSGSESSGTGTTETTGTTGTTGTAAAAPVSLTSEQLLAKAPELAKRILKAGNTFGRISKAELLKILIDLGVQHDKATELLKQLPSESVSMSDIIAFQQHSTMSFDDLIEDQKHNLVIFGFFIWFGMMLLWMTTHDIEFYVALGVFSTTIVLLAVVAAQFMKSSQNNQVKGLLSTTLARAMSKISFTIAMAFAFAALYHFSLYVCGDGRPTCANAAIPICTYSGLPPSAFCLDEHIQCAESSPAICLEQEIPGGVTEHGSLIRGLTMKRPAMFVGPTRSEACQQDLVATLCQADKVYMYGVAGTPTVVVSPLTLPDVASKITVANVTVGIADKGTNCANVPRKSISAPSENLLIVYPPDSPGIYDFCYSVDDGKTFTPIRPETTYFMVAAAASCGPRDCLTSDFTPTMSGSFFDDVYFSLVTHSTVGFGEMAPISKRGMILVAFQALFLMVVNYF